MSTLHVLTRRPVDPHTFLRLVDVLAERLGQAHAYTILDLSTGGSRSASRREAASVDLGGCMVCARGPVFTACATNAPIAELTGNVYVDADGVSVRLLAELAAETLDWWLAAGAEDDGYDALPLLSMLDSAYAGYRDEAALERHIYSTLVVETDADPEEAAALAASAARALGLHYPWWGDPRGLWEEARGW